jgi:hypothetical protein
MVVAASMLVERTPRSDLMFLAMAEQRGGSGQAAPGDP